MHPIEIWGTAGIIFLFIAALVFLVLTLRELRLLSVIRREDLEISPTRLMATEETPYFLANHTATFAFPKSADFNVRPHTTKYMERSASDYIPMYSPAGRMEYVDLDFTPALLEEPYISDYVPASSIYA